MYRAKAQLKTLLLLFLGYNLSGQDMTLQELQAKYYEAIGGKKQLDSIGFFVVNCSQTVQGSDFVFPQKVYVAQPNKIRIETYILNDTFVKASDGQVVWEINPFSPKGNMASERPVREKDVYRSNYFFRAFEEVDSVAYLGMDTLNSTDVYKVAYTIFDDFEGYYYFDTSSFLLIHYQSPFTDGPFAKRLTGRYPNMSRRDIVLSDYSYFSGIYLPTTISISHLGTFISETKVQQWEQVDFLPDSLFQKPN